MHKKMLTLMAAVLLLSVPLMASAASSIVPTMIYKSVDGSSMVIKLVCTAHTDGTFTSTAVTGALMGTTYDGSGAFRSNSYGLKTDYWNFGYFLLDAWSVNSATDDHTNAAVVTITDATGRQLIGATAGDTLSLSQTASAIAYAAMTRSASQRAVTSQITVAIADTGSTATVQTLYLVLGK